MTNANHTDITAIIDKSGSMAGLVADTIGGFNTFLEAQQKTARESHQRCTLQVVQFDDQYEPGERRDVIAHPKLNNATYVPRGMTALLDAMGRTITAAGARFQSLPEHERPGKVLFVVITDGYENHSREYTGEKIKTMLTTQQNEFSWDFIYLGANQDAWAVGSTMGFKQGKTLSTTSNAMGTRSAYAATARYSSDTIIASCAMDAAQNAFLAQEVQAQIDAVTSKAIPPATGVTPGNGTA